MTGPTTQNKPFIPSYRLFEDLVDMKNKDGGFKASGGSNSLFGASTTSGMRLFIRGQLEPSHEDGKD
ncbi:hypothetical protein QJS10_CPB21g01518 [Acorus calamus]|uniref:Uncharacterized protein n=1 Tax=Acorus calamus TaxID=4465 RepID=A0AAV9C5K2_ACOCL|nr:hypothetical protein QJS10_CPB21g01518 [Acorus calamus]